MPKTKISEFSATPANNTDIDSINIAEGCAPSGINDAIRELMAQLKDFQTGAVGDSFNGPVGTSTAAAGAFTTLAASGAVTLSGGTANGVTYLNGSKVLTSGSALTFDGTNLGVGATSPVANVDIQPASTGITKLFLTGYGTSSGPNVQVRRANGTQASPTAAASGQFLGGYHFGGYGGTGFGPSASGDGAGLQGLTAETWTDTAQGASIRLLVTPIGATAASEAVRILSTGNVGIGTTSPAQKLDVEGTIRTASGSNNALFANNFLRSLSSGTFFFDHSTVGQSFVWRTSAASALDTTAMTLTSGGNLGIGTSSPAAKLDTAGTIRSTAQTVPASGTGAELFYDTTNAGLRGYNRTGSAYVNLALNDNVYIGGGSAGNVGIGTSSPAYKLTVSPPDNSGILISSSNDAHTGYLYFGDTSSNTIGAVSYDHSNNSLRFQTSSAERVRITSGGDVGIGTTSPQQKLVVSNGGAEGLEISPNAIASAPAMIAYNRSGGSYLQLTASALRHVWQNSGTEAMRLDSTGLGVGNTSPAYKLDVLSSGTANNASGSPSARIVGANQTIISESAVLSIQSNSDMAVDTGGSVNFGGRGTSSSTATISYGHIAGRKENGTSGNFAGYLQFGTSDSGSDIVERARITSGGDLLVGATSTPAINVKGCALQNFSNQGRLAIGATVSTADLAYFYSSTALAGAINVNGSVCLYSSFSDQRLKENIIDADSASSLIDALQVRKFDWKADGSHQRYGFIAQELVTVAPEAVHQPQDTEEMMAVDYSKLVPMLVKEIQSLRKRLADAGI